MLVDYKKVLYLTWMYVEGHYGKLLVSIFWLKIYTCTFIERGSNSSLKAAGVPYLCVHVDVWVKSSIVHKSITILPCKPWKLPFFALSWMLELTFYTNVCATLCLKMLSVYTMLVGLSACWGWCFTRSVNSSLFVNFIAQVCYKAKWTNCHA